MWGYYDNIPKAIFYLLKGGYRVSGVREGLRKVHRAMGVQSLGFRL